MGNRERVIEFIDSCDGDDSFDGDFSRLRPVSLTDRQARMEWSAGSCLEKR